MKNIKRLIATAVMSIFVFTAVGCSMVEKTPEAIKKSPVAKINEDTITKGQLDERMDLVIKQMKAQYGPDFDKDEKGKEAIKAQKDQMLQQMIVDKILMQKGKELKLIPEEAKLKEEIDKKYEELKKAYPEAGKLDEALKQAGFTEATYKSYLKEEETKSKIVDAIVKDAKVDDSQIQQYYTTNQMKYTEKPNTIHVAHILLKTEEEAKKAKERIDKGEDFAAVAKELGTDGTKDKGGDLGVIEYNTTEYDKTFMTAAIMLPEGTVSAPVQTKFGFHIIKAIKKNEYPVKKLETVKEEIKAELLNTEKEKLYNTKIKEWKDKSKIKTYEKNM